MASVFEQHLITYESGAFAELWIDGIYTALLLLTVWLIVSRKEYSQRQKIVFISCNMAPYLVASGNAALAWATTMKILAGTIAMGPASWHPLSFNVLFFINNILAEAVFIWRCWIVWGRKWVVVVLPIALTVLGTIAAVAQIVQAKAQPWSTNFIGGSSLRFYGIFQVASVMVTTILITWRIAQVQKSSAELGRTNKNSFSSVIEIIVESAALYIISLTAFTVVSFVDQGNGVNDGFHPQVFGKDLSVQNIHLQISGLAPLLINFRVQAGFARAAKEWSSPRSGPLNALTFASRGRTESGIMLGVGASSGPQR